MNKRHDSFLRKTGMKKISALDEEIIKAFGKEKGIAHVENLMRLFDGVEQREYGLHVRGENIARQKEIVAYLHQNLKMSLLAADWYDSVFFREVMPYLDENAALLEGDVLDIGCGNGILTAYMASIGRKAHITGIDEQDACVESARKLAQRMNLSNVAFALDAGEKAFDTVVSIRTFHENIDRYVLDDYFIPFSQALDEARQAHMPYAKRLSSLLKDGGALLMVERYEESIMFLGLLQALAEQGMHGSLRNKKEICCDEGDEKGVFQCMVLRKGEKTHDDLEEWRSSIDRSASAWTGAQGAWMLEKMAGARIGGLSLREGINARYDVYRSKEPGKIILFKAYGKECIAQALDEGKLAAVVEDIGKMEKKLASGIVFQ